MTDFSAPQLDDTAPPPLFRKITSGVVQYNMDFVGYLITQEVNRRREQRTAPLSEFEAQEFKRELISKLIIQGNADAAIALRPRPENSQRQQLNG